MISQQKHKLEMLVMVDPVFYNTVLTHIIDCGTEVRMVVWAQKGCRCSS